MKERRISINRPDLEKPQDLQRSALYLMVAQQRFGIYMPVLMK
ncbi:MAG TPA: hypothetical protein PLG84_06620 [Anaerolineaceae bacterium]|jgi:hypothetical protein|nr:hypothetical protein [Anaerolineaceae bacterium]